MDILIKFKCISNISWQKGWIIIFFSLKFFKLFFFKIIFLSIFHENWNKKTYGFRKKYEWIFQNIPFIPKIKKEIKKWCTKCWLLYALLIHTACKMLGKYFSISLQHISKYINKITCNQLSLTYITFITTFLTVLPIIKMNLLFKRK